MKIVKEIIFWVILLFVFSGNTIAKSNFVTIDLPESVSVDLPKNWVLISNNKRITLDTATESTFDINKLSDINSRFPFAANYYEDGITSGIINVRYYPDIEFSQNDARQASPADISELDNVIHNNIIISMDKTGATLTSWEGTEKRTINGITTFITEYHRTSIKGSGTFRVRLVRVIAGERSFTLTISYLESKELLLENITDRIISSIKMNGHK